MAPIATRQCYEADSNNPQVSAGGSGYRVFVKVRPMSKTELVEDRQVVDVLSDTRLRVAQPYRAPTELKVDRVLRPEEGQTDFYHTVADVVSGVVQGRSGTILAYGQTGSGKTYMMMGPPCTDGETAGQPVLAGVERGLIPRALENLFAALSAETQECRVRISFMEIYNEQVYDLLDSSKNAKSLELREARHCPVEVPGLQAFEVHCLDEALELLEQGTTNRAWGNNGFNSTSSRSHALFQVLVDDAVGNSAKLSLVDLAGSEKLQAGHGAKNTETTKINLSLTSLGQCIAAMLDVNRKHVPYRNSKLTRLLQESLQNPASATVMCVCISPAHTSLSETMSSLQFADRAKRVVVHKREQLANNSSEPRRIDDLLAQLQKTQTELAQERQERLRLEGLLSQGASPAQTQSRNKEYTMEEGTSTLLLAFEMAKQGLEDIISVVEVLDHDVGAVMKAKQGLQEIVGAVDILHKDALTIMKQDGQQVHPEQTAVGAPDEVDPLQDNASFGNVSLSIEEIADPYSVELAHSDKCVLPQHPEDRQHICDSPWEPISQKHARDDFSFEQPTYSPRTDSTENSDFCSTRRDSSCSSGSSSDNESPQRSPARYTKPSAESCSTSDLKQVQSLHKDNLISTARDGCVRPAVENFVLPSISSMVLLGKTAPGLSSPDHRALRGYDDHRALSSRRSSLLEDMRRELKVHGHDTNASPEKVERRRSRA